MSEKCLRPEELADLTADDPRRAHVAECPRCQAVIKSYFSFLNPVAVPAEADLSDAETRLSGALDQEIGRVFRPSVSLWTPFRVRTAAAVAAVVIVAVGLSFVRTGPVVISPDEPVLRGIGAPAAPFVCQMEMLDEGSFRVSWPGIAEATGYRLVVYGKDLEELGSFDVGTDTTFDLEPPAGGAFCRVIALREGDEMGRSEPAYFDDC